MQLSHACRAGTASRREHIADGDVFNECRIEADLGVHSAENARENLFRARVLKTALLRLIQYEVSGGVK